MIEKFCRSLAATGGWPGNWLGRETAVARRRPDWWSGLRVFSSASKRLGCGGDQGFGSAEFGDDAELLHEAQSVPVDMAFEHFAVRKAGNA